MMMMMKGVGCDKMEKKIGPNFYTIPYERLFSLVLWVMVGEIFGQPALVGAKSPILNRYSLVAPQP